MSDRIRLAILGTGEIAAAHLEGYKKLVDAGYDRFEIVALCDNSQARRDAFAAKVKELFGWEPAHFEGAEDLAKSGAADAVDNCTPHAFHHTTAIPCLDAGMHVMVEKPCGITIKASNLIMEAAARNGRTVAVSEQVRRGIKARAMKWALTEAKMIGDLRFLLVQSFYLMDFNADVCKGHYPWQWRLLKQLTGGGMIFDGGAHFADMIYHMFGEVEDVIANVTAFQTPVIDSPELGPKPKDVEDTWFSVIRFKSGLLCNFAWSFSAVGEKAGAQMMYGTLGSARDRGDWMHVFQTGGDITFADGSNKPYEEIEAEYRAQLDPATKEKLFPLGVEDDMAIECWDFIDAIDKGRKPEIDADDTKRAKSICLALYESSLLGGAPVKPADVYSGAVSAYQDPINAYWGI